MPALHRGAQETRWDQMPGWKSKSDKHSEGTATLWVLAMLTQPSMGPISSQHTVLTVPTCSHTPLTCVCPFTSTSSAKRTFTGFVFSLALFSAVRNDDLGPPWKDNSTQLAARPVVPMHRRSSPQYSHGCNHSQRCFHHTTSHLQKRETLGASHLPAQSRHAAGFQTYLGSHWAQTQLPNNKWTNMQHILCTTNFATYLYSYCV